MQIIPTVLEKDINRVEERVHLIGSSSKWIQIDVIDNKFSRGKSFELELLTKLNVEAEYLWEIHLMVNDPEKWIEKCLFVEASRIIGQVEKMVNREEFVKKTKDVGLEAGLAFDIETEVDRIPEDTDLILLMARKAGFESQKLDERIFKKIQEAKRYKKKIAVDGGVTRENLEGIKNYGVDVIYSGSKYFEIKNDN